MKITIRHFDIRSTDALDKVVEEQLLALGLLLQVDEATVRLERNRQASPRFRVCAHLVTPGPDVFAQAQDHTMRAAIDKLVRELHSQLCHRSRRRKLRLKSDITGPRALPV